MTARKKTGKPRGGADKQTCYMLQSQLDREHFHGYDDAELLSALDAAAVGNAAPLGELLCSRIEAAGGAVKDCHFVVHNADTYSADDVFQMATDGIAVQEGEAKPPHFHGICRAPSKKDSLTISAIAEAIGMAPECVQKAGTKGRYAYENMAAYLTHANAPAKHQYSPDAVANVRGMDYRAMWDAKHAKWEASGAATKAKHDIDEYMPILMQRVRSGYYYSRDEIAADPTMRDIYVNLSPSQNRALQTALDNTEDVRYADAARLIREKKVAKTVIWISGRNGGDGKTNLAVTLAEGFHTVYMWHYEMLTDSTQYLCEDYHGSEIVIFDDLKPNDKITTQALLSAFDNYRVGAQHKRYHNAEAFAPRVCIVTSIYTPEEFWTETLRLSNSDGWRDKYDQFFRRMTRWAEVRDAGFQIPYNVKMYQPVRLDWPAAVDGAPYDNAHGGKPMTNYAFVMDGASGLEYPLYSPQGAALLLAEHIHARSGWRENNPDLPLSTVEQAVLQAAQKEYEYPIKHGELPPLLPESMPYVVDKSVTDLDPYSEHRINLLCALGTPVNPDEWEITNDAAVAAESEV